MNEIQRLKKIKMEFLERMEKMKLDEIKRLSKIKLEELNRLEKIKLEEMEHLEEIKLSEIERLKQIKFDENERFSDMKNLKFLDNKSKQAFIKLVLDELEIFGSIEMKNLERIKEKEMKRLEKIKNEEMEKNKNLIDKEIEIHENLVKKEFELNKKIIEEGIEQNNNIILLHQSSIPELAAPPINMEKLYQNNTDIRIVFSENNSEFNNSEIREPIIIECSLEDKISILIDKYNEQRGNDFQNKKFLFENKELSPNLTVGEERLFDGCKIKVINIGE